MAIYGTFAGGAEQLDGFNREGAVGMSAKFSRRDFMVGTLRALIIVEFGAVGLVGEAAGASESNSHANALFPEDQLLAAQTTLDCSGLPVADVLAHIRKDHRISLEADRAISEQRICFHSRRLTIRELMAALATLLNCYWVKLGETGAYELKSDFGAQRLVSVLLIRTLERGAAPMFRLVGYLRTSAEQYQQAYQEGLQGRPVQDALVQENAFYLGRSGPRTALRWLDTLSAQQRKDLLADEQLILTPDGMSSLKQRPSTSRCRGRARLAQGRRQAVAPRPMPWHQSRCRGTLADVLASPLSTESVP